tara:strand:+ start:8551 stop:10389 length:1839 start_codon:yes stop_codon:yes gene_type:complete
MNIQEIYELGLEQGWDEADAFYLATIAWAESKGVAEEITDEPDGTQSYGIWQINSIHLPKLVEAGILHQPDSGEGFEVNLNLLIEQLADPVTNAIAAEYVGHRRDHSEPTEDWDFTRWSTHALEITDANFPGNYGEGISRNTSDEGVSQEEGGQEEGGEPTWDQVEVPWDFQSQVLTEEITQQFADWGFTPAQQTLAWQYLWKEYGEYADGTADKNISSWLREGGDVAALTEVQGLLTYLGGGGAVIGSDSDYTPGTGSLPTGWLSFWGEDNSVVGDWLDMWLDRFNANAGMDIPYSTDDLEEDFFNAEDGLFQQEWWNSKTDHWLKMAELWYTGGGPGTAGFDAPLPETLEDYLQYENWEGTGQWQQTWNDSIKIIQSVAEDLGIVGNLPSTVTNGLAFRLMREGGASAIDPAFARNWATEAHQIIEEVLVGHLRAGSLGVEGDLGVGTIASLENEIRAHAASQLITVTDEEVRAWALDIKSEQGLNKEQVFATLDNKAYGKFGVTNDYMQGLASNQEGGLGGGVTISDLVDPLHEAATQVWEDGSYRKNDQWLMDNYQEVMEDGSKRFRTAQEMRNLARGNVDRFQHSKQYQNPLNDFIRGAAAMFRSDY